MSIKPFDDDEGRVFILVDEEKQRSLRPATSLRGRSAEGRAVGQ